MKFCALSSGSSGNCFYFEENKTGIIIDAGISCKKIVERFSSIGISESEITSKVKGILITHEHCDHIRGADVFARKFNIPIFATKGTLKSFVCSDSDLINEIKSDELINFNGFDVQSFLKSHKSNEPVSYSISGKKIVSVITDAGFCCENIHKYISQSNVLCLESNHDLDLLKEGPYPWPVKNWIKSDTGHLSNTQAGLSVLEHAPNKLKAIMLSHISEANNTPELALSTFKTLLKERKDLHPRLLLSTRENVSEVVNC